MFLLLHDMHQVAFFPA